MSAFDGEAEVIAKLRRFCPQTEAEGGSASRSEAGHPLGGEVAEQEADAEQQH
jgi:hypothetical protein